jgi:hypothetical protein
MHLLYPGLTDTPTLSSRVVWCLLASAELPSKLTLETRRFVEDPLNASSLALAEDLDESITLILVDGQPVVIQTRDKSLKRGYSPIAFEIGTYLGPLGMFIHLSSLQLALDVQLTIKISSLYPKQTLTLMRWPS